MKHLNQDLVLAVLDISDPIEAAKIRNYRISMQALAESDNESYDEDELGFGVGEAAVWMSPAIIAVCKWIIDVGQSTLRDELKEYVKKVRQEDSPTKSPKLNPEALDEIRKALLAECKKRKMNFESAEKAADAMVKVAITRPDLLSQLTG